MNTHTSKRQNDPTTHCNHLCRIVACAFAGSFIALQPVVAQQPQGPPLAWVQAATDNEVQIIAAEGTLPMRYKQRKVDAHGDTTREIVETRDGAVARLIERDGQPLTAVDDAAERDRLTGLLSTPDAFLRHHRRDSSSRDMAVQLVKLLPQAMLYTYVPDQPKAPGHESGADDAQVVIDYAPNPSFHPPSMAAELLTGIAGRVWIDKRARRVTRIEAHVLQPVNFGFGMIARIFPGGTVVFEQVDAAGDNWVFHHMEEHLTVRELMVKTVPQNNEMTSSDFHTLPSLMPYQDAIKMLLAMQVATH